jgi:hypothetical protein
VGVSGLVAVVVAQQRTAEWRLDGFDGSIVIKGLPSETSMYT